MRYYFTLFVVFSIGALVLAAPTGKKPTTKKEDVQQGIVYWPLLKHLEPKDPSFQRQHANFPHPVVAVSDVDAQDKVKVAVVSHNPTQWGSVEPASNYADLKGFINVGPPKTVHVAHLKPAAKSRVNAVRPGRLQPLIDRINENCAADQQLTRCEPPGSAQGDTVHGRPEHDHSKQSSEESSSNKGSSSQVSPPGSPKQSSPKQSSHSSSQGSQLGGSKQGSQLDGSKQGSPSGSSDDRQVATGRRSNKARGSGNK